MAFIYTYYYYTTKLTMSNLINFFFADFHSVCVCVCVCVCVYVSLSICLSVYLSRVRAWVWRNAWTVRGAWKALPRETTFKILRYVIASENLMGGSGNLFLRWSWLCLRVVFVYFQGGLEFQGGIFECI